MCLITESTQQRLVIPLYRGEHEIDIYQYWKIRKEKFLQAKVKIDKFADNAERLSNTIQDVVGRFTGMRVNQENLENLYYSLVHAGMNETAATAVVQEIRAQYRDFDNWDGTLNITVENRPTRVYQRANDMFPRYVTSGPPNVNIEVRRPYNGWTPINLVEG